MEPLLAAIFDARCTGCGVALGRPGGGPLCAGCWSSLARPVAPACGCGAPSVGACARCRRGRNPLASGASLGLYEGLLRRVLHAFKYEGRHRMAEGLAVQLLATEGVRALLAGDVVLVPVPLHARRERARGFNQCVLLARALGRAAGVRVCADALTRLRDTPPQAGLTAAARRANVDGAFAARRRREVQGRVVVLVEDVVTTGATVRACAAALRRAGALEVRLLSVARVA